MMGMGVPIEVVLVEDNPGDVRLVREGLEGWTLQTRLHVVRDGEEALSLFRGEGSYAGTPRPDLVILDLNMPRKDGREVLAEMQADPTLRKLPVVVFTNSIANHEVLNRCGLKADLYIVKPVGLRDFLAAVRLIEELWRRAAEA